MKEEAMRNFKPAVILASSILIVAATGCDSTPMGVQYEAVGIALSSSGGKSGTDLCQRTTEAGYTKTPEAANRAGRGIAVSPIGECAVSGTSRLVIENAMLYGWDAAIMVYLYDPDLPGWPIDEVCPESDTCTYDVPTGSTVVLVPGYSVSEYTWTWNDSVCTGSNSCEMNGDRSVRVDRASIPAENVPYFKLPYVPFEWKRGGSG
jgi:hypothetical protein